MKKMKRTGLFVALLALALLLTSCVMSENPLSNPRDFAADSRLEGVWHGLAGLVDQRIHYLHFVPIDDYAMDDVGEPAKDKGESTYLIFKYEIAKDGSLTIWSGSPEVLKRDVSHGRVAGTASWGATITDNSANLRNYIQRANDLFTEQYGTFRKILPKVPEASTKKS